MGWPVARRAGAAVLPHARAPGAARSGVRGAGWGAWGRGGARLLSLARRAAACSGAVRGPLLSCSRVPGNSAARVPTRTSGAAPWRAAARARRAAAQAAAPQIHACLAAPRAPGCGRGTSPLCARPPPAASLQCAAGLVRRTGPRRATRAGRRGARRRQGRAGAAEPQAPQAPLCQGVLHDFAHTYRRQYGLRGSCSKRCAARTHRMLLLERRHCVAVDGEAGARLRGQRSRRREGAELGSRGALSRVLAARQAPQRMADAIWPCVLEYTGCMHARMHCTARDRGGTWVTAVAASSVAAVQPSNQGPTGEEDSMGHDTMGI